jgi:hypothetical protein
MPRVGPEGVQEGRGQGSPRLVSGGSIPFVTRSLLTGSVGVETRTVTAPGLYCDVYAAALMPLSAAIFSPSIHKALFNLMS